MPADTLRFTVIVPTMGDDDRLGALLDALAAQTLDRQRWDLVVSFDGAAPSPAIALRLEAMNGIAVSSAARRGPGAARNLGASRATGDYLAFTEDDCTPAPEWLERAAERLDLDPDLDAVEGATLLPDGRPARRRHGTGLTWLPTNLFVRRSFFERTGGYCERFFDPETGIYFREDSDFGFTAIEMGGRAYFDPRPRVVHPREHPGWLDPLRWARRYEMDPLLSARHPASFRNEIEVARWGPFRIRRPFVRACAGFLVGAAASLSLFLLGEPGLAVWFASLTAMLLIVIWAKWRFEPRYLVAAVAVPVVLFLALWRGRRRASERADQSNRAAPHERAEPWRIHRHAILPFLIVLLPLAVHLTLYRSSEPFYNNDETRHVMTGLFVQDALRDLPLANPRGYVTQYYLQYPALAIPLYPPLFYLVEGVLMLVAGTSMLVPKVLVLGFLALACGYLYRLVRTTHDETTAVVATLIFAFSPLVFELSRQVMLEVPTLSFVLVATYHIQRYLDGGLRRDLVLACAGVVAAALTRFSGILLAPFILMLLVSRRQLGVLARKEVLVTIGLALLAVVPFYAVTWATVGWVHAMQVAQGLGTPSTSLSLLERLADYPRRLPTQMSWFAAVPALVGLAGALGASRARPSAPYLALAGATYMTFAPMAIHDSRFVVYWVPAFALFAADAILRIAGAAGRRRVGIGLVSICILGTTWVAVRQDPPYVRGYETAARYVLSHTTRSRFCLFDGGLNGDFIYQMRRNDPGRRMWVLRADKILYSILLQPTTRHEDTPSEQAMLEAIARYAPEFIVVESPPTFAFKTPAGQRLRALLRDHQERFSLSLTVPIQTNRAEVGHSSLWIYRNLLEGKPPQKVEFEVPMLRKRIETPVRNSADSRE